MFCGCRYDTRYVYPAQLGHVSDNFHNPDNRVGRMLVQEAARLMDELGNAHNQTRKLLSLVKAHVPKMSQQVLLGLLRHIYIHTYIYLCVGKVIDDAIQIHGAMGVSQDTPLWFMYVYQHTSKQHP